MNTKEKSNVFTAYTENVKRFFSIAMISVFVFFIIGQFVYPSERDSYTADCKPFDAEWVQVLDTGERVPVEVPGKVEAEYGELVTLETTVPEGIVKGDCICFRTIWQDLYVYVGDELRISYNTESTRPFGTNSAMHYNFLELKESDAGKVITYQFLSNSKYAGDMRESYIGDRFGIWMEYLSISGVRTVISIFLVLLSAFCLVTCGILKVVFKKTLALTYLSWTVFLCALWMLSEVEFRQIIFKNTSLLSCYTYWSLMLISLPLLLYINDIQERRFQKIYIIPTIYSCTMMILGTILQVFEIVQFVEQIPFIHAGTALAIIMVIITIIIDIANGKMREYISVGIGILGLLVTSVIELLLYYIDIGLTMGTILGIGLLFLLVMAIIKTGQDLFKTEQKRQQAILAREAQAKFLASMSHEIRTPINAIIGMNEMILRENENATIEDYAYNIQSASNMLLGLVNDVLDFSKIESGQLELVEDTYYFASVMQDELLLLKARSGGLPISTQVEIDEKIPAKLFGDELRIKQILTNILSNAVKYTKEGSVTFKASFRQMSADVVVLVFTVEDTGIGIREEDMPGLFDSFKRLELNKNRNIQGTGLGLNIAKQLVDLMQGEISVKSEYGKGSVFTIMIPQKVMDATPVGSLEEALAAARKKTDTQENKFIAPDASVLVVDDNAMNLTLMKGLLKRTQMCVDVAKSGVECLKLTRQKKYDMIFMDHMMPDMDGVETLHKIKEDGENRNRETIVVALTANAIAGCRETYLGYGFNDYFSKPIQADKLEELLQKYLGTAEDTTLLEIDREVGLSYCLESEDFYCEMLVAFCAQAEEYLPELEEAYTGKDWGRYAIIAHGLKTNSLNIGATNFSKVSLRHEMAGKEQNTFFIEAEYAGYRESLEKLIDKLKQQILFEK